MMSRPHSKYIIQRKVLAKHIFLLYLFSPLSKSVATIWCMAAMNKGKECGLTCYLENILHHCTFRDYEGKLNCFYSSTVDYNASLYNSSI